MGEILGVLANVRLLNMIFCVMADPLRSRQKRFVL